MSDGTLRSTEGLILTILIAGYVLLLAVSVLRRRRPDFDVRLPVVIGLLTRFAVVVAVNATGSLQASLRGGDETTFLDYAHKLAGSPWGHGFWPHGLYQLHVVVFAIELKLANLSQTAMRVTQIGFAMLGIILIAAAVYDLAGSRPARWFVWIMAFEPANLFFNSELHKEPLMVLASGLVVFGGTKLWRNLDLMGVIFCALGSLIAIKTRSYAGWFLVSASVFILFHAALRRLDRPMRAMPIVYAVVLAGFLVAPTLLSVTSNKSLRFLQNAQNYTTGAQAAGNPGGSNSDNLALEKVNFSTRGQVIQNLPKRVFDLLFKPFPWQLQNRSQQVGALGSVIALGGLVVLLRFAWMRRRRLMGDIGPLFYPFFFLMIAYALSEGNAGTGFRYRTHLVLLGAAALVVLRERVLQSRAADALPARRDAPAGAESGPGLPHALPA